MRNKLYLPIIAVILAVGAIGIFYLKQSSKGSHIAQKKIVVRKTLCDLPAPQGHIYINRIYLNRVVSGLARAVIVPAQDAKCLPDKYDGAIDFIDFQFPQLTAFSYVHSLNMELIKSADFYSLKDFEKDPKSLALLGYKKFSDLRSDLEKTFGPASLDEDFVWFSLALGKVNWSKSHYEVPDQHPLAKIINKADLESLVKSGGLQLIDVRDMTSNSETIPGAKSFVQFPEDLRLHVTFPEDLKPFTEWIKSLNPDQPIVLFDKNETRFAAYNLATILSSQNFKKVYILRRGFDEWKGIPIETPKDLKVQIVNGAELVDLGKKNRLLFIDVRNKGSFDVHHLREAKNIPANNFLNKAAVMSLIEVMPGYTPVIMGKNEYDWRPYKVLSAILKDKPELGSKILWYRSGMSDTHFLNQLRSQLPESEILPITISSPERMKKIQFSEGNFKNIDE